MEIFYTKNKNGSWTASDAEGHSCSAPTKEMAKNQLRFLYHNDEIDFIKKIFDKGMKKYENNI